MSDGLEVRKFLFDLAFDGETGEALHEKEKPKPTFTLEQMEQARKESYDAGLAAGRQAAQESQQQYANLLLTEIEARLSSILQSSQGVWRDQLAHMREIAKVMVRKLFPTYEKTHGLGEVEAVIAAAITEMSREPRLVIRVAESQFDEINNRISQITTKTAYAGKIVLLGDPDMSVSDCRVEWADGGIERDVKVIWELLERVIGEVQQPFPFDVCSSPQDGQPGVSPQPEPLNPGGIETTQTEKSGEVT